jgi:protein TonB
MDPRLLALALAAPLFVTTAADSPAQPAVAPQARAEPHCRAPAAASTSSAPLPALQWGPRRRLKADYYPPRTDGPPSGCALLECRLGRSGRLIGCVVLDEQPANQDFGPAAVRLSRELRLKPARGAAGRTVQIPIKFQMRDDPAPSQGSGAKAGSPRH